MRALDKGCTFTVTRNGVPIGELKPISRRQFMPADVVVAAFRGAPPVDAQRFRRGLADRDATPRG